VAVEVHPMPSRGLCRVGARRPRLCLLSALEAMSSLGITRRFQEDEQVWSTACSRPGLVLGEGRAASAGSLRARRRERRSGWSGRCCICQRGSHTVGGTLSDPS
jgi:hypothetical protein